MAAYYAGKPTNARFFRHAALHSPLLALAVTAGLAVLGVLALEDPAAAPPFSWGSPIPRAGGFSVLLPTGRGVVLIPADSAVVCHVHFADAFFAFQYFFYFLPCLNINCFVMLLSSFATLHKCRWCEVCLGQVFLARPDALPVTVLRAIGYLIFRNQTSVF